MEERLIGRHTIRFEPPWFVHLVARGHITPEEAVGIAEFIREHGRESAFLMSLNDMRELGDISADARKAAGRALAGLPFRALAFIGGFRQRLVIKMAMAAVQVFTSSFRGAEIGLFDAEAAAREWLAERARRVAS